MERGREKEKKKKKALGSDVARSAAVSMCVDRAWADVRIPRGVLV